MSRVLCAAAPQMPSTAAARPGDYDVRLRGLRDGTPGPLLRFSIGREFVGVWREEHCCAVLDRDVLRLSLPADVETNWTVDELTWANRTDDVVLVGLSREGPGLGPCGGPQWWRMPALHLAGLRERV